MCKLGHFVYSSQSSNVVTWGVKQICGNILDAPPPPDDKVFNQLLTCIASEELVLEGQDSRIPNILYEHFCIVDYFFCSHLKFCRGDEKNMGFLLVSKSYVESNATHFKSF